MVEVSLLSITPRIAPFFPACITQNVYDVIDQMFRNPDSIIQRPGNQAPLHGNGIGNGNQLGLDVCRLAREEVRISYTSPHTRFLFFPLRTN